MEKERSSIQVLKSFINELKQVNAEQKEAIIEKKFECAHLSNSIEEHLMGELASL